MRIEIVHDESRLSGLDSAWNALLKQSAHNSIFLTFEWFYTFIRSFDLLDKMAIILIYEENEIVGILPLYCEAGTFMGLNYKALKSVSNVHTPKFNFIVKSGCERLVSDALALSEDYLPWDFMALEYISDRSDLESQLRGSGPAQLDIVSQPMLRSPYVLIDSDWNAFYNRESLKSYKKSIAYLERRAERDYGFELESVNGSSLNPEILMEAFIIEDKGWKGQNRSSILKNHFVKTFYTELASEMNCRGWFNLDFLRFSGKRVAFDYCLKYDSYYCTVKIGYDEDYKECSPGRILRKMSLKKAFDEGFKIYDMLGGADEYKMKWTSNLDILTQIYIFTRQPRSKVLKFLMFTGKELAERVGIKGALKRCYLMVCAVRKGGRSEQER